MNDGGVTVVFKRDSKRVATVSVRPDGHTIGVSKGADINKASKTDQYIKKSIAIIQKLSWDTEPTVLL